MAFFGKGAPPVALLRHAQDRLRSFETPQDKRERRQDSLPSGRAA